MFLKLGDRLVVVVGGGVVAEGKIPGLLEADARVRLIAPAITPGIAAWVRQRKVDWLPKEFEAADLDGAFLVIAATSAPGVNEAVFREAESRAILCNAVDDVAHCHFYYGAVVQRGDLQITISTNGKSPALAQRIRKDLEQQYGEEYALWLDWLGTTRELIRGGSGSGEEKKALLHHLASREMFERFREQTRSESPAQGAD
jgi:precorrin-2 dehydrogenase / sirohydrochlorin ferrochelatase